MFECLVVRLTGNTDLTAPFTDHNISYVSVASRGVIQVPGRPPTFPKGHPLELKDVSQKRVSIFFENLSESRVEILVSLLTQRLVIAGNLNAEITLYGNAESMLKPSTVGLSFAQIFES